MNVSYNEEQEQRLTQEISKKLRAELRTELYDEVTTEVTDRVMRQFQQQFESYGMRPQPSPVQEPIVPPTAPVVPRDDMDDDSPCLLYVLDGTGTMLVARGTVFKAVTIVHGMELSEDEVKVLVDDIIIPDASISLPTNEIFTMAQAFQTFIAWPKHLVGSVSDSPTYEQEKIHLSKDDPIGALQQLCDIIKDEPMKVEYDANVFGRGFEVPIYLHSQYVGELASGREELNITLIHLWMMYMLGVSNNLGYNDVYGLIDPQVIHEANDFDDITTYLTNRFGTRMMLVRRSTTNGRKLAWVVLKVCFCDSGYHKNRPAIKNNCRRIGLGCSQNRGRKPTYGFGSTTTNVIWWMIIYFKENKNISLAAVQAGTVAIAPGYCFGSEATETVSFNILARL
ncbi:hypothetical protein LR48_Vigan05g060400 [Vigna angularis]|uniref:DUF8039 domain-containing protein n=1 Tax=Phaseolus angularis TaxID=3914 RepID=A0A0L9UJF9_PHAAN|nr:hypothetical protein LR48_Vigan05g060400 [Vigna angularis]